MPTPIFLDTDIGDDVDDALALAYAATSSDLELVGVSTVWGDTETRAYLAEKILHLYGYKDIPVGVGSAETSSGEKRTFPIINSAEVTKDDRASLPEPKADGVQLLIDSFMSGRASTLVTIGPLTNLAIALEREPKLVEKIEKLVIMGGATKWNMPEYNIRVDAKAAAKVFTAGIPITLCNFEICQRCRLSDEQLEMFNAQGSQATKFLYDQMKKWDKFSRAVLPADGFHPPYIDEDWSQFPDSRIIQYDVLAVAVAGDPSLIKTCDMHLKVETESKLTLGYTVPLRDPRELKKGDPIKVSVDVDEVRLYKKFLESVLQ